MFLDTSIRFALILSGVILLSCSGETERKDEPPEAQQKAKPPELSKTRVKQLNALGYFDRAPTANPEKRDVTKAEEKAFEGINLYNSRHRAEAYLIDNNGKLLHKWTAKNKYPAWMHTELQPNGDILVIAKLSHVARYNWQSKLLWKKELAAHHDLAVGPNDNPFVITSSAKKYPYEGGSVHLLDNSISVLSKRGRFKKETHFYRLLRPMIPDQRLRRVKWRTAKGSTVREVFQENTATDVFHTNSIQILPRPIPSIAEENSFLLSVRELNRIVILDEALTRVLWSWGEGEIEEQHHATLLDNGNIMVFDNGVLKEKSRVIEVNPSTGKIEWSYSAPDFYTKLRGAAQKLPNGNVLITESDKGHAFEITPKGKTVWEFWNPDVLKDPDTGESTRAVIYRMIRHPMDYLEIDLLSPDNAN